MTLIRSAPVEVSDTQAEALFREARRRRHRRWAAGLTSIVIASLVLGVALLTRTAATRSETSPHATLPGLRATDGTRRLPDVYLAGDGKGGVGVYSTATGSLIRTLSPQSSGGPDGQAALSADRQSVFFAQPSGTCGGDILRVPTSGTRCSDNSSLVAGTLAVSRHRQVQHPTAWPGLTSHANQTVPQEDQVCT